MMLIRGMGRRRAVRGVRGTVIVAWGAKAGRQGGRSGEGRGHQQILRMKIVSKRLTDLGATLNACKTHMWPEREIRAPCTLSVGTLRLALDLALEQNMLPLFLAGTWHITIQVALFLCGN
jgi:hypothetical protein